MAHGQAGMTELMVEGHLASTTANAQERMTASTLGGAAAITSPASKFL
jgi:hypothetical protein